MKVLAWILGVLAVAGSVWLGFNWRSSRVGVAHANAAALKAQQDVYGWLDVAQMDREHLESRVLIDGKKLYGDDLDLQIAQLQGQSTQKIRTQITIDRATRQSDQMILDLARMTGPPEADPRVAAAAERRDAAKKSRAVYAACVDRDGRLAYALGVVWLAFGFAAALAAGRKQQPSAQATMEG